MSWTRAKVLHPSPANVGVSQDPSHAMVKRDSYGIPTVLTYPFTIKLPVGDRKLLHTLNPKSYISLYTRNPIALRRWSMAGAVV